MSVRESAQDASARPHRPLTEFYQRPSERPEYIAHLFNSSAQYYDWISSVLAFGSDRYYRKMALRKAGLKPGMRMLDVATGTGLVARAALQLGLPKKDVIGLDPSAGMLGENSKTTGIQLFRGFGERLPFKDASFDFISMGYALRHVESLSELFTEFRRVLKPGGRVLVLEISRPQSSFATAILRAYMNNALPVIARFRTNSKELRELLKYYWATIEECVPPDSIVDALKAAEFANVERRRFGPMLNDYFAEK
ncbi:MAG TPA: class I SAM-dependent methyltransferase [Candidatus Kapabacteria bacterium]|nr:class I SAM-dependent methyltransferase [Candidatus Kapabacteria bacterium]